MHALPTLFWVMSGISEALAVWFLVEIWKRHTHIALRLGYSAIVVIPLLGPLMYLWVSRMPSAQSSDLMNRNMRYGDYTQRQITRRRDLDKYNRT